MTAPTRFEHLDRLLPALLQRWVWPLTHPKSATSDTVRIDLSASGDDCEVRADLRGARQEDIELSIDGDFVSISAELEHGDGHRRSGVGERTRIREFFSLPFDVDEDASLATYANGVLTLSLHKKPRACGSTPVLH
jgi:HSP20 family protein